MGVDLPPREINTREPRLTAQAIFRRWLPLPDAILRMVVRCMPDPTEAQRARLGTLLHSVPPTLTLTPALTPAPALESDGGSSSSDNAHHLLAAAVGAGADTDTAPPFPPVDFSQVIRRRVDKIKRAIARCSTDADEDVVVFVSKMTPVRVADLSPRDLAMLNARAVREAEAAGLLAPPALVANSVDGPTEVFMALGRVFSGVLRRDSKLVVLGHRHDPTSVPITASSSSTSSSSYSSSSSSSSSSPSSSSSYLGTDGQVAAAIGALPPPHLASSACPVPPCSLGMYICLGPSVFPVEAVPAGNIVVIIGLDIEQISKTATLAR